MVICCPTTSGNDLLHLGKCGSLGCRYFGNTGQTDVVCYRFDTRKVGPVAVGPASFGSVVDCTFPM